MSVRADVAVADPRGIHGRVTVDVWKAAFRHRADIIITAHGREFRPPAMPLFGFVVRFCALRIEHGEIVEVRAEGPGAAKAIAAVRRALNGKHSSLWDGLRQSVETLNRMQKEERRPKWRPPVGKHR